MLLPCDFVNLEHLDSTHTSVAWALIEASLPVSTRWLVGTWIWSRLSEVCLTDPTWRLFQRDDSQAVNTSEVAVPADQCRTKSERR
jgi:hypothetical protein